jgi:protein RecA
MAAKKKRELTRDEKLALLQVEVNEALGVEGKVFLGRDLEPVERIQTGMVGFDIITGGGLVRRHYLELYGEESAGKSLTALRCVSAVQKQKGVAVWVTGEEFDDDWAEKNEVDVDKLIKIEALTGDKMLETAATYLESGLIDLLVCDSVQSIGTAREMEGGVESESYAGGGAPQLWGRFYRRTRGLFNGRKSNAAIIGISQVRDKIGGFSGHGPPEPQPTQIRTIKHWKSISIQCKRGEPTFEDAKSDKKRIISREFHWKCKKNKTATPERTATFRFGFTKDNFGIDHVDEIVRAARVFGLIEQGGANLEGYGIKVKGTKENPAVEQFKEKLAARPATIKELYTDIIFATNQ